MIWSFNMCFLITIHGIYAYKEILTKNFPADV